MQRDIIQRLILLFMCCGALAGCRQAETQKTVSVNQLPEIFPDYTGVTLPPNIAPVNFRIIDAGELNIVRIRGEAGDPIIIRSKRADICIPERKWAGFLQDNKGKTFTITVFTRKQGIWYRYAPVQNTVAEEPIDPWFSYRLIEPSYVNYSILGIYQRCLDNYQTRAIYTTARQDDARNKHCINCHTYKNRSTSDMFFHVRGVYGGTVFVHNDRIEKVNTKTDSTLTACVYPSYHPTLPKIAFSVNETRQTFHSKDIQKVEVVDFASDLVLYDIEKHEVTPILQHTTQFETFPTWSPDGRFLYYCSADFAIPDSITDKEEYTALHHQEIFYDLFRISYDPETGAFGDIDTVLCMSERKCSVSFPRVSPDGKYLMLCISDYGNFSIWHKSSDLYTINLETGTLEFLWNVNSPDVESFHSWSSNGRWFVFSTRREDGNYTRPYFAYFDRNGEAHKPFALPHKRPVYSTELMKSYNLPEFMTAPVTISPRTFDKVIMDKALPATYSGK